MRRRATALSHWALTTACLVVLAVLALAGAMKPLGMRALVDHSDSMRPTIAAGDVVVTKVVPPRSALPGDVVSFQDPERKQLLTHRVVRRRAKQGSYDFVTRGDANTGVERWSIDDQGRLGVMVGRVPRVGYALAWLQDGRRAFVLVALSAVLLGGLLIRRVVAL